MGFYGEPDKNGSNYWHYFDSVGHFCHVSDIPCYARRLLLGDGIQESLPKRACATTTSPCMQGGFSLCNGRIIVCGVSGLVSVGS